MAICNRRSRFLLIGTLIVLTSCSDQNSSITKNGEPSGEAIYSQTCKVCHGAKGDLGISNAADLSTTEKTPDEKLYIITNGSENGMMTSYKGALTEKEISAVNEYIETLKNK